MSTFIVSARKYRPARFDEVVGQQHVSQTLKNALQSDHLAHAFLFCGPRGVGKTTCARILAKVLNCQNRTEDYEPCGTCNSCKAFDSNASFNITELDAASNNSVEHIRSLIEQVRFQPQQGAYKVYIIDEVHMLSQQAFNAFLKTLEEPPPYAIFILATTEKHKIIPTILSRCQIFDFKRIQIPTMVSYLKDICAKEKIKAEESALHIIAQKADGALRDALSIFDRIVSFSGNTITYDDTITNLNILDYDYYFKVIEALLSEDGPQTLLLFNEILDKGFEPDIFMQGLAAHIRDLLVCKDEVTLSLLEAGDDVKERYMQQAGLSSRAFLLTALNLAGECDINYRMARNKRLLIEMTLLKMAYASSAVKNQGIRIAEENDMEKKSPEIIQKPASQDKNEEIQESELEKPKNVFKEESKVLSESENGTVDTDENIKSSQPKISASKTEPSVSLGGLPKLARLADIEKSVEEEIATEEVAITSEKPTMEKILPVWQQFAENHPSQGLKNCMKKAELMLEEEQLIVKTGSRMAKNLIVQETQLLPYLRKHTNVLKLNWNIVIDPALAANEVVKKPKKLLTIKEKYDILAEVNPKLHDLRKKFNLKIDHD